MHASQEVQMGDYADVNGVHMYYETHGAGDPILLLHGGVGGASSWQAQVPDLAERHNTIVPELRGRGHTADIDGEISYRSQAEDIIAFLERVVLSPVHLIGASDGGVVGLLVAMQRPELLRNLVTIGTHFHHDGLMPGSMWTEAPASDETWAMPRQRYQAVSPDGPAHWPIVFAKLQRMWREEPTLHVNDLRAISIPVLVMVGDDDIVQHSHTIALYEALPLGQLAIVPATSHAVFLEKPGLVNRLILEFLDVAGPPQTLLPIRRSAAT
jgi:pimeloyl-ACP methyl ester carboxylesterase